MGRRKIENLEPKILAGVLRMNAKEGIANISTRKLAKKLGISEPVLFSHFMSKQGLLDAAFEYAWGKIYGDFGVSRSLLEKDFAQGFAIYRAHTDSLLSKSKDPILFAFDYLTSSFRAKEFSDLVMKDAKDALKGFFLGEDPQLTPYDLDLIVNQNIHLSLIYLVEILRGNILRSERSDAIYYTLRRNGYLALLKANLSPFASPK